MKSHAHIEVPGGPNALTSSGLKRSELASTFAADPPGGGLGLSGARHVADIAFHGRMARALLHGWGMYNKHAIERYLARPEASWMRASYWWPCRLVLAGGRRDHPERAPVGGFGRGAGRGRNLMGDPR